MSQVAKLFTNVRSQAVRLPTAYRFETKEVFIREETETGDVILSRRPSNWDDFFIALKSADVPTSWTRKIATREHWIVTLSRGITNEAAHVGFSRQTDSECQLIHRANDK